VPAVSVVTLVERRPIEPTIPARPPLWMHKEDATVFGAVRNCAPCPAVMVLLDDGHAIFNEQWQYFVRAINYAMSMQYVSKIFGSGRAFFNGTGFTGRHNWLTGEDADQPDPNADKVRTCSRNVLTGTPQYSLVQALRMALTLAESIILRRQTFAGFRASFAALVSTNVLNVTTFDSRTPPPLKAGRTYPRRVEEIRPDDYLITPASHPWMFAVANIVNKSGEVVPWPNGGYYPWTGDGQPRTWLPLVSNHGYGDVLVPLSRLQAVAPEEAIPSPYKML
jgi:hypothetical protein